MTPPPATAPQAPAQPAGARPAVVRPAESSDDSQTPWVLLGIGAGVVAAIAAALLSGWRRRSEVVLEYRPDEGIVRPARAVRTSEPEPESIVKPTARTPLRAVSSAGPTAARVIEPTAPGARRAEPSLVEMLSPRLRVEEEEEPGEQEEQEEESEKQEEQVAATPGAPGLGTCEIRWWRGPAESRFYVEGEPPLPETIESPPFRAYGRGAPMRTSAAHSAHEVVVQSLVAAGWRPNGRGVQWFSGRFTSLPLRAEAEAADPPELSTSNQASDEQGAESESKDGRNSSFVW